MIDELWLGLFHWLRLAGNQAIRSNDIYEGWEYYILLPAVIMNVPTYLTIEMSNIILQIMPALYPSHELVKPGRRGEVRAPAGNFRENILRFLTQVIKIIGHWWL